MDEGKKLRLLGVIGVLSYTIWTVMSIWAWVAGGPGEVLILLGLVGLTVSMICLKKAL